MSREGPGPRGRSRAASSVVGVAVLLALTVVALAGLTASIGHVVDQNAAAADAAGVADDLDGALRSVETTGHHRGQVSFASGSLATVERDLRVLNDSGVVARVGVDGVVFEAGDRRVAAVAGAVTRTGGGRSSLVRRPPVTAGEDGGVLVVGAPRLNSTGTAVSATGVTTVTLATNVSHERRALGDGRYRVAVETRAPGAWERYFQRLGATTDRRDLDDDGLASVVARFPGERTAYLVVHDARLEVRDG